MWLTVFSLVYPIVSFVGLLLIWRYAKSNSKLLNFLAIAFLCVSILLQYVKCCFGIDYTDTTFQLKSIELLKYEKSVMSFGTILLFNPLLRLIGFSVFYSRIIGTVIFQLSCLLPFITYLYCKRRRLLGNDLFLAILSFGILFTLNIGSMTFSYDLLTTFMYSVLFSMCLIYHYKKNFIIVVLLSIASALSISVRYPNILIVVSIPILIGLSNTTQYRKTILHVLIYLFSTLIAYCLLVYIAYGDVINYINALNSTVTSTLQHNETHGVNSMIGAIVNDGLKLIIYIFIIASLIIIECSCRFKESRIFHYCFVSLFGVVVFVFLMSNDVAYGWNIKLYELAVCFTLVAILLWKKEYYYSILSLIVLVLPIAGSDTGLLKVGVMACLPFLIVEVSQEHRTQKALAIVLFALMLYFPFAYTSTYEDLRMTHLSAPLNQNRLSNILTSKERANSINNGIAIIKSKQKEGYEVVVLGNNRHLFVYVCGINSNFTQPWRMSYDNVYYIENVVNYSKSSPNKLFFIVTYSQDDEKDTDLITSLEENNIKYQLLECK